MNEQVINNYITIIFGIICFLIGFLTAKIGERINKEIREDNQTIENLKCYRIGLNEGYERGIKVRRNIIKRKEKSK